MLVVPKLAGSHVQMTTFILLSDVTDADGPTKVVPLQFARDRPLVPNRLPLRCTVTRYSARFTNRRFVLPHIDAPIANLNEATAQWLEQVLAGRSEFARDPIGHVTFDLLGDGIGQMSELLRASVTRESGYTHQLVIKLHTTMEEMRDIGIRYNMYLREANFYTLLAASVPIRTPKVFAAAFDKDSRRTALVMEHFGASHYSPDQVAGATLAEIELAVDRLAMLSAQFWDSPLSKASMAGSGTSV